MITIIDYGVGNLGSIFNMLKHIGVEAEIVSDPRAIGNAKKIILPGVGAFDHGMRAIRERGMFEVLNQKALEERVPVLGICLGMQLITTGSDEGGEAGFSWIAGSTVSFSFDDAARDLKIPHMGWNSILVKQDQPLLDQLGDKPRFYFVHGYHVDCADDAGTVFATTHHGYEFPSVIGQGNIFGAQFHPEKSHKFGMRFLQNFAAL